MPAGSGKKGPDLRKMMNKRLSIKINKDRRVVGTLRGYDQFMNVVIADAAEVIGDEHSPMGTAVIRGSSIVQMEAIDRV